MSNHPSTGYVANPQVFREYDIRGVADRDFDAAFARRLGRALAAYLADAGPPTRAARRRVAVGHDCRLTSAPYAAAARAGLRESGIDVVDLGMCPTPLCYFALFHLNLDGAIQVTGSHNPPDQNGFKICAGKNALYGDEIRELRRRFEEGRFPAGSGDEEQCAIVPVYLKEVAARFPRMERAVSVVVDAGNGTAGPVAPPLLRTLGCNVDELYCEPDGRFPNHHPDPIVPEYVRDLAERVVRTQADIGVGFDGDADRIGVVDGNGRMVFGDELLVIFARDVLQAMPGSTIVSEVKCSQRLFDDIAARGGNPIMWKAGHSPIKAKMRELGAVLGGEVSGHMFFADRYFGFDDAIYAACRLVEILSRSGRRLDELLADLPPAHATPEIRIDCPDPIKFAIVERVRDAFRTGYDIVDVDGVRVRFARGWGLLRASNTQPALVLRFEAETPAALEEYRHAFEDAVQRARIELQQG